MSILPSIAALLFSVLLLIGGNSLVGIGRFAFGLVAVARPCQLTQVTDIAQTERRPAPRISFVSLGCPKALVDSERILTRLRAEGYELSRSHAGADAVIVNTCGFLDSAKRNRSPRSARR